MKKVLSMVAALLLCVGTQAQIVSSRSAIVKTEKQASSTQWFLRAGLNIMNFSGDGAEGADSNIGYNATFGYQKPLGSTGGYWGMEFGLGSRGFKVDDTKCMAHNIQYSPFTFGWKFAVADNVLLIFHNSHIILLSIRAEIHIKGTPVFHLFLKFLRNTFISWKNNLNINI